MKGIKIMFIQNNFNQSSKSQNLKLDINFKALRWDENTRRLGNVVKKEGEDFFERYKDLLHFNYFFSKEQCEQLQNALIKKEFNMQLTPGKNSYALYDSKDLLLSNEENKIIKNKLKDIEKDYLNEYEKNEENYNPKDRSAYFKNLVLDTVKKHKLFDTLIEIIDNTKILTTEAVDNLLDKSMKTSEWVQKQLTMIQEKVQNTNNEIINEVL